MKRKNQLLLTLLLALGIASPALADSKRIEVYPLSQNYWDTKPGETLGEIAAQLLPHNSNLQQKLMTDIINLNPDAFLDGNPDFMRANVRLWLPNNLPQTKSETDPDYTQVETFSWGSIKRPKR